MTGQALCEQKIRGGQNDADRERLLLHLLTVIEAARTVDLDKALKDIGLSGPKHRALLWLDRTPTASMKELARHIFVDRTTLTRAVDQLVSGRYVERSESPVDRRVVLLSISPSGRSLIKLGQAIVDGFNRDLANVLEPEEVRSVNRGLIKLLKTLVPDDEQRDVLTARPITAQTQIRPELRRPGLLPS